MTRTLEAIDCDLKASVEGRKNCRVKLKTARMTKAERDQVIVQEELYTDRIERFLEERSVATFTQQVALL